MKITDVAFHVVAPMGDEPVVPGSILSWAFVEVSTDVGLVGLGECSNWVRDGNRIIGHTVETLGRSLIGMDARNIEAVWQTIFRNYSWLGSRGLISTVISGIDIALWDLKGQVLGVPVYELLGGRLRERVDLYGHPDTSGDGDIASRAARGSSRLVEQGFAAMKIDPFEEVWTRHSGYHGGEISRSGINAGAEVVGAMRDAVGPDVELMVDAHGAFNVATAMACMQALEPFGLTWFEEPVPPEGLDALRQVRRQARIPLCVGERLFTRWDVLPVLQEGLADYLMPDVCWTGGISELKRIATMAEAYFVPVSPHNALGPVQVVAGAHTMLTVPNFYRLEFHPAFADWYSDCLDQPLDVRDGALHVSDRPGLGFALDHDYVEDHRSKQWET